MDVQPDERVVKDQALSELAATALAKQSDTAMWGNSLVLLASRNCSVSCPVSTRPRPMRDRDFGPIE